MCVTRGEINTTSELAVLRGSRRRGERLAFLNDRVCHPLNSTNSIREIIQQPPAHSYARSSWGKLRLISKKGLFCVPAFCKPIHSTCYWLPSFEDFRLSSPSVLVLYPASGTLPASRQLPHNAAIDSLAFPLLFGQ